MIANTFVTCLYGTHSMLNVHTAFRDFLQTVFRHDQQGKLQVEGKFQVMVWLFSVLQQCLIVDKMLMLILKCPVRNLFFFFQNMVKNVVAWISKSILNYIVYNFVWHISHPEIFSRSSWIQTSTAAERQCAF